MVMRPLAGMFYDQPDTLQIYASLLYHREFNNVVKVKPASLSRQLLRRELEAIRGQIVSW